MKELAWYSDEINLCATCVKGGLDSRDKIINYIGFATTLCITTILLSTLHKDISSGSRIQFDKFGIDPAIFDEVKKNLISFSFRPKLPIYSTGGYVSIVYTNGVRKIIFKEYITKKSWRKSGH